MLIHEAVDAFDESDGLVELLQTEKAVSNPGRWLRTVYFRCFETLEVSSSLLFVVDPLIDLMQHLTHAKKRSTHKDLLPSLELLNMLIRIIQEPDGQRLFSKYDPNRSSRAELVLLIHKTLLNRVEELRSAFVSNVGRMNVKCAIGSIAIQLGYTFQPDEEWQRDFLICDSSAALNIAVIASKTYSTSGTWLSWAKILFRDLCSQRQLSAEQAIQMTVALCILLDHDAIGSMDSSSAAKRLVQSKVEATIALFGDKARIISSIHFLGLQTNPSFALMKVNDLLSLAFAPHVRCVDRKSTPDGLNFLLYPPGTVLNISKVDPLGFTMLQKEVIRAIAGNSMVFGMKSNIWLLWGLPNTEEEFCLFAKSID